MVFFFICVFLKELERSDRNPNPAHKGPIRFDLQRPGTSKSGTLKAGADGRLLVE